MQTEWSAFNAFREGEQHEKPTVRMDSGDFLDELRSQAEYHLSNPNGDKYIAAFNLGIWEGYKTQANVRELIERYLDARHDITLPSHAVNLPLRAIQKQLLRSAADIYPLEFDTPESWQAAIAVILGDEQSAAELRSDLGEKRVQSNKSERYVSIKPLIRMFGERMDSEPRILDIGCSRNHGLKKIALNLPFAAVKSRLGEAGDSVAPYESSLMNVFGQLVGSDVVIGKSIGSDIVNLEASAEWAKACSFYPSELVMSREDVIEYDALDVIGLENVVEFVEANFINRDLAHLPGYKGSFDIVMLSTVMYQLSEAERFDMLSNALWHVKDGGIVVVQDFAEIDPSNPRRLIFKDHWFEGDYPYRTFVLEVNGGGQLAFREFFRWKTSRCRDVLIMSAASDKLVEMM